MKNKTEYALKQFPPAGRRNLHASFFGVLVTIIFATALFSCKNETSTQQAAAARSTDSLHVKMDSLQSQYNASHAQIDELTSKSAALDSMIKAKDAEIAKLDVKIKRLERSNKSLAAKLRADKKLIASLRDDLSGQKRSADERIGLLQNDKNDLIRQRDSLYAKYNHLKELGSVLHASNIHLQALHLKRNGLKEKNTHRARRADVLRVSFDIDENRIAEDGTKKLYLVIKDPNGNLLSSPAEGSGTTTASDGCTLNYSIMKEVPLKQNQPVYGVSSDWKQDNDFKKGDYNIAIYNGGYKIGGGKVTLN